jgi:hypothetical protein
MIGVELISWRQNIAAPHPPHLDANAVSEIGGLTILPNLFAYRVVTHPSVMGPPKERDHASGHAMPAQRHTRREIDLPLLQFFEAIRTIRRQCRLPLSRVVWNYLDAVSPLPLSR